MDTYQTRKREWDDLDITKEELNNLKECMKKEEFRKLLIEYAEEVTDPENRKTYEREITQLEKERGVDVTFVNPEPGYVIKTSLDGEKKCFINISKSDIVARPTSQPSYDEGQRGLHWSIPYTLVPPRDDLDKKNLRCMVFDVVFHPDAIYLASKNARFREILNNTALDGVEANFKVKLDRKNLKFPKMDFKGISQPSVIRKPSKEPSTESHDMEPEIYQKLISSYDESRERHKKFIKEKVQRSPPPSVYYNDKRSKTEPKDNAYATPKFVIKHQAEIEMQDFTNDRDAKIHAAIPKKLVIIIDLPLLKNATDASLDVQERFLTLKSEKPAKYLLELPLPYCVDADLGNAKFDSKYKKLTVTLPVIRKAVPAMDYKEDSGVESDHGSPVHAESDGSSKNVQFLEKNSVFDTESVIEYDKTFAEQKQDEASQQTLRYIKYNEPITNIQSEDNINESKSSSRTKCTNVSKNLVLNDENKTERDLDNLLHSQLEDHYNSIEQPSESSSKVIKCEKRQNIVVLNNNSSALNECSDTVLWTNNFSDNTIPFMNPNVKYTLPAFHCNICNNQLAITVNVKNVDPSSIQHRLLDKNVGIHILLTSIGAGFFPQYYSFCFKMEKHLVEPDSLSIDPWDNNVVFTITLKGNEELSHYHFGLDEEFMEQREIPNSISFENKLKGLTQVPSAESENREVSVEIEESKVIINIRRNQLDSDDEDDREAMRSCVSKPERQHKKEKVRSISESSCDELPSNTSSTRVCKGILKSRRVDFSRSVSESSADENAVILSSADFHYDSVHDVNSESDCSSFKKTVRFNDVVSRQLFRSNSSILGQRKKNQRKLRNKKRAHDRRMSESENSETDEKEKYKVHQKPEPGQEVNVKPILNREKQNVQEKTENIKIDQSRGNTKYPLNKRKSASIEEESGTDIPPDVLREKSNCPHSAEFKNDLIFDLDM